MMIKYTETSKNRDPNPTKKRKIAKKTCRTGDSPSGRGRPPQLSRWLFSILEIYTCYREEIFLKGQTTNIGAGQKIS
jgi:hypothetical protein